MRAMIVAIVACGLALAGPVAAAPASRDAVGHRSGSGGSDTPSRAPNFAGYNFTVDQSNAILTTTIVLPKLRCGKANEAIEPGTGAYYSPGAITDLSTAGMFVGCHGAKARYYPAFTLNAVNESYPKLRAKAGDTVVLKVLMGSAFTTLSVVDKTTKSVRKKLTGSGVSEVDGVWAGDSEYPATKSSAGPVPRFGKVTFSDTLYDGLGFGDIIGISQYDRYRRNTLQIATGPIIDQETFNTVFRHM